MIDYENIHVTLKENEKPSLILYKYRWIVLISFFLTSAAVGNVSGSLSTNRPIIMKIDDDMEKEILDWAKYSDLIMYLPMNFASIWIIENFGLRKCITLGSVILIFGSVLRLLTSVSIWLWFVGHIVCLSSQAFLRNPVTKLASNWFGDKERSMATAVGIVSGPLGLFVSMIMIVIIFDDKDKFDFKDGGNTLELSKSRFNNFITINSVMTIAMVIPALIFIRDKPPSPPSMIATKPRPVQSFR